MTRLLLALLLASLCAPHAVRAENGNEDPRIDTTIMVDKVQVTAIKQGLVLRDRAVTASVAGAQTIGRRRIDALKELVQFAPNFHLPDYGSRMTSSIYVRGLGARIDQPVMGLNVDNVPVLNKDNYDFDLVDAERIEVLRGPQSTLYGRNTMGGVINIYTLSPLSYQGTRLGMEYGSGDSWKFRLSTYHRLREGLGVAGAAWYARSGGFFSNLATGERCDWERQGGGRFKVQWQSESGLRIDNTLAFTSARQGGYPYAYAGEEIVENGQPVIRPGEIRYNDPCSYERITLTDGVTLRYDWSRFSLSSITSYQYSDDEMVLDQDFLPLSYFTLRQAHTEHTLTEDIVFKSREERPYRWLFGLFGFYRHGRMEAPVLFKRDGIDRLILANANAYDPEYRYEWADDELPLDSRFRMPDMGAALYHESNYALGRWLFTAGIRIDFEHARLRYENDTETGYRAIRRDNGDVYPITLAIHERGTLKQSFTEVLPKFSVLYRFDGGNTLYLSVAKGYKAGGFNTQMFSDILQQQMMKEMGFGSVYNVDDVVTYKPEKSWNYELGSRLSNRAGTLSAELAAFLIECSDQQLTVFPAGTTTGRMMTNAGRTRSLGAEASVMLQPAEGVEVNASYGYTHATFVRYDDGRNDYAGKCIPYAPQHTFAASATWTIPTGGSWIEHIVLHAGVQGAGRIWWDEANTLSQPFYALVTASVRLEHRNWSVDLWGRNLGDTGYDTFRFVSIGNSFLQRGRPRTFGITLNINL